MKTKTKARIRLISDWSWSHATSFWPSDVVLLLLRTSPQCLPLKQLQVIQSHTLSAVFVKKNIFKETGRLPFYCIRRDTVCKCCTSKTRLYTNSQTAQATAGQNRFSACLYKAQATTAFARWWTKRLQWNPPSGRCLGLHSFSVMSKTSIRIPTGGGGGRTKEQKEYQFKSTKKNPTNQQQMFFPPQFQNYCGNRERHICAYSQWQKAVVLSK